MCSWAAIVLAVQIFGHLFLAVVFTEHTNHCSWYYESPNNPGGWLIVCAFVLPPTYVGLRLRKYLPVAWVLLGALVQTYMFINAILDLDGC